MADLQNKIVGIAGRKGSGKSTTARHVLERLPRIVVYDPLGEHRWIPNRLDDLEGVERFLAWASAQQTCACSFIPDSLNDSEFSSFCDSVYDYGNLTLAVEEIPMLCGPSYLPPSLDRIVRLGRHRRVNLVWTAQRMAEVARRLTAATDLFVLFAHTEPRDLDAIGERCGREVAGKVSGLGLHDSLCWDVMHRAEAGLDEVMVKLRAVSPRLAVGVGNHAR